MIFITLGTQDKHFVRLLEYIDKLIDNKVIGDKVVVQCGHTTYESENMEMFDFVSSEEFNKLINECKYLITHGGVGSIITGLNAGKKVIAVARLKKYGEHENDHQVQIVKKFEEQNYIKGCVNLNDLNRKILELDDFEPRKFKSNAEHFCRFIQEIIEK